MLRRLVWQKFTNVSEVLAASIIKAMVHPRRQSSSSSLPFMRETDFYIHTKQQVKL
jgi:hypothetical protein